MNLRGPFFNVFTVAVIVAASVFYVSAQESDGILLNKRPLVDFGREVTDAVASRKVDLAGPFLVELSGNLDNKGKLVVKGSSFTRTEGDPALVDTVKRGILAINDAGFFQYLKNLDIKEFRMLVEQTPADLSAQIFSNLPTEERAKMLASGLSNMIQISRFAMEGENASGSQKRDAELLKSTNVRAEDSTLIISFVAPAAEMHKLVAEKLAEHSKNGQ